jgi:hypothetical protein
MSEGSRGERGTGTPDVTIDDPDGVIGGTAGGGSGERATGTPNIIYNLSSVLFHALQGGASYDTYVEDAEKGGDEELTEFFRRVREEDRDRAAEARMLLAERTPTAARAEEATADVAPRTEEPSGVLSDIEPGAEGASPGNARRTYAVTEMPDEDLTPPEDAVPADAPGPAEAPPRAEAGQPPRTEPVGPLSGEGDMQPTRTDEVASPRPEPSDNFPGTEPVRGDDSTARSGEVSPPKEVPPERAGEIPTAEEVPPPRAEEIPTGTQTQASPGDATSLMPGGIPHEGVVPLPPPPPKGTEESPTAEEERAGQQEEDKGLVERVIDKLTGEEEQRGEGTGRPDRR